MAKSVVTENKKTELKNTLCQLYGVRDVHYSELSYGIGIDIEGVTNFRFVKIAIHTVLKVPEESIISASEWKEKMTARNS